MYDATFITVIFGDESPGKTIFIQRYLTNLFESDQTYTIGVKYAVRRLSVDEIRVKLQIMDLGNKDRFRFLIPTYVRKARGGLFFYDVTNYSSIRHIDDWLSIINFNKDIKIEDLIPIVVVGIVPDEMCERQVSAEEGIKIAKSRNLNGFIECNPKTGENVEKVFEALTRLILDRSK